jgi:hypothetical protein
MSVQGGWVSWWRTLWGNWWDTLWGGNGFFRARLPGFSRRATRCRQWVEGYDPAAPDAETQRQQLLAALRTTPMLLSDPSVATFLYQHVPAQELATLEWQNPRHLMDFYVQLYAHPHVEAEVRAWLREQAGTVLATSLRNYAAARRFATLIDILRLVPHPPGLDAEELEHFHHLARLYEARRVLRNRRRLYSYLLLQVLLISLVFPLLFMNAENGAIQRQIEETTGVELGDEGYRLISYPHALYWAIVTATSIGYGDITPMTNTGRMIAALLGTLGVVTIGVVAGLILRWITPREFG